MINKYEKIHSKDFKGLNNTDNITNKKSSHVESFSKLSNHYNIFNNPVKESNEKLNSESLYNKVKNIYDENCSILYTYKDDKLTSILSSFIGYS